MKLFLYVVALFSVVLATNALPTVDEEFSLDYLNDIDLMELLVDNQKIDCVLDGLAKIVDKNADLKWWFDEIEKTVMKMTDKVVKCATSSGLKLELCLLKLKFEIEKEVKRVVSALPKEKSNIWVDLQKTLFGCFP